MIKHLFAYLSRSSKLEDTLKEVIEYRRPENKKMSDQERYILHNFLEFGGKNASDVMIPRSQICALKINNSFEDVVKLIKNKAHTRMPVYRDNLDQIAGFINIKDLFVIWNNSQSNFHLEKILRKALIVPPKMRLIDLLSEMQNKHTHIAIVIDEHGGTDGMVTIEDVIEELVGEIQDEHDSNIQTLEYKILDKNTIICNARMEIGKVEALINQELNKEQESDFETIAGLVLSKTGTVPSKGEVVQINEVIKIEVLEADPRYIKQVKIYY